MSASPPVSRLAAGATGLVTIDLGRIAANWRALARLVAPAECAAVVKADAYGLGAARVIPALVKAGCQTFFIATPPEAEEARARAPNAALYALDGLIPGAERDFVRLGVRPVLSSLHEAETWVALGKSAGRRRPAGLHIDSGLNRLGLVARDVRRFAADATLRDGFDLTLVMSHLASADNPADPKNREQLLAFETLSAVLPRAPRSLAASDGMMLGKSYHFDLVRPGYAVYGGQASQTNPAPVMPAVAVAAQILAVNDVAPGETVGYGASWRAERPSRIATIAAGYADGVPRSASSDGGRCSGQVKIGHALVPIVGRVSMDLITADVTDLNPSAAQPGALATLIGPSLTIEDAGFAAGTIGYELLTRLGRRFTRVYIDDTD